MVVALVLADIEFLCALGAFIQGILLVVLAMWVALCMTLYDLNSPET